ncbi:hypothetical protein JEM67_24875 [Serratia sp. PAMC26656]
MLNLKNNKELFMQYSYEGNDKQGEMAGAINDLLYDGKIKLR